MPTEPSVCYLLEPADLRDPGGLIRGQAGALARCGHRVTVAVRATRADPAGWPVPVIAVPHFGGRNLPDADCYIGTSWAAAIAAHGTGLGIGIHLIRGDEGELPGNEGRRGEIDMVYGLSTVKLAVSRHLAELMRDRVGQQARLTRAGIDGDMFHARGRAPATTASPPRIAVTGSGEVAWDGVAGALAALRDLRRDGVPFELVRIASDRAGAGERAVLAADEHHEAADDDATAAALRTCDIAVVLPSAAEGTGIPALRAMACGCATVLSDIPAFRDLAGAADGDPPGLLVDPGDTAALAAAVGRMIAEPRLRDGIARRGVAVAARHTWNAVAPELDRLMRDLIEEERTRWLVLDERMVPGEADEFTEKTHRQRYEYVRQFAAGRRVLDIGCGVGCGALEYARAGAVSVHAIDKSPHALAHAKRHFDHPAISWNQGEFFAYEWPRGTQELAICLEVFEHVDNPGRLMGLIVDALTDDGRAIISTPNRLQYSPDCDPVNVHHVREYEMDEFTALLGAFFGRVEVIGQSLHDGVLRLGPPDPAGDLIFVAMCSEPIRRDAPGGPRVVGAPDWDMPADWRPVVDSWCSGVAAGAGATLALSADSPERAGAALVDALERDGIDPAAIPDIEVSHGDPGLHGLAPLLRGAALCVPMGSRASRQRRLAECFGVDCLDRPDPAELRRRVEALSGAHAAG